MTTPKNPLLGHWQCERGGTASVRQTTKKGRHFYTNCECCGLNQGTGEDRQQAIWDEAKFIPGTSFVKPANVSDTKQKAPVNEPEPAPEPEKLEQTKRAEPSDFDPTQSEPESETESEPSEPKAWKGKAFAGIALILAAGVGAWMN